MKIVGILFFTAVAAFGFTKNANADHHHHHDDSQYRDVPGIPSDGVDDFEFIASDGTAGIRVITEKWEACNDDRYLNAYPYYLDHVLNFDDVTYHAEDGDGNPVTDPLPYSCSLNGDSGDIAAGGGAHYHLHANDGIRIVRVLEWHPYNKK